MVWGILAALGSSLLRAGLNVLDREIFGRRHAGVVFVNLANNFLPLLILFPVVAFLSGPNQIVEVLSDVRNLWLAGLTQLVAYAFSLAFRDLTIPQVIVFSKLPDLFIPIGIYALSRVWSPVDFAFSALTTIVCLPVLFQSQKHPRARRGRWWVLAFLVIVIVLRGVFSGHLVQGQGAYNEVWLLVTMAILWWRFIWSLMVTIVVMIVQRAVVWTSPGASVLLGRAGITLAVQALYVFALATGPVTAVWPLINSTALFSTGLSSITFREHPSRREIAAICGIMLLMLTRMLYDNG